MRWRRRVAYLVASAVILFADQMTKMWAVRALRRSEEITIINGFLDFVYAENRGIAFGQFQEGGALGRWFLVALAATAAIFIFVYFFRRPRTNSLTLAACAFLLAGITGNLMDRARFGYVIDFILVHAGDYQWPVFNIADASICAGAALLAYEAFFVKERSEVGDQRSVEAPSTDLRPPTSDL